MPDSHPDTDPLLASSSAEQGAMLSKEPSGEPSGKSRGNSPEARQHSGDSPSSASPNRPRKGLFITGTDTNVGKTFVGAIIVRSLTREGYRVGVYKPVASGCEQVAGELQSADALALWEAAGRPADLNQVCPQRFAAPLAPNLAARAAGRTVDAQRLRSGLSAWTGQCDVAVVEGAGGLYSPISDHDFVIDLARDLAYPLIVVAANRLGTINATLQTVLAARAAGLQVAGIVLNTVEPLSTDPSQSNNAAELVTSLKRLSWPVPLLGTVACGASQIDSFSDNDSAPPNWKALCSLATPD